MLKKYTRSSSKDRVNRKPDRRPDEKIPLTEVYDSDDPGDETQRNFRYQHAYGVILLAASITGRKSYVSLWCEHHEDFLAEDGNGCYDAYQIKTRKPEIGPWQLNDAPLRDSVKKFVQLEKRFPGLVRNFYFASNAEVSNSMAEKKIARSPRHFLHAIRNADSGNGKITLAAPFNESFEALRNHCECTAAELAGTWKKVDFIKGPGRDSFEDEVAHTHLPAISGCESHPPAVLNGMRDELIQLVYKASSLEVTDPAKHWHCLNGNSALDPRLLAKKITVESARRLIDEAQTVPLRFTPETRRYELSVEPKFISVLEKKFIRAGLGYDFDTMRNRAFAAERHLMEIAHKKPERIEALLTQLTAVVKGECDEARLFAQAESAPYGHVMLRDVTRRLRNMANNRPEMVEGEVYECLMGIAGLLTAECAVWWSEEFDLEEAA